MKMPIMIALWLSLIPMGLSQITMDSSYFPQAGDTLRWFVDDQPIGGNYLTNGGGGQTWDFSLVDTSTLDLSNQIIFKPANEGSVFDSFPNADVVLFAQIALAEETYLTVSDSALDVIGTLSTDPLHDSVQVQSVIPAYPLLRAPLQFGDASVLLQEQVFEYDWIDIVEIADSLCQLPPVSPTKVRLTAELRRYKEVDAWGDLHLPYGAFDVLREREMEIQSTKIEVLIPPSTVFEDVTIWAIQCVPDFAPDTIIRYYYFTPTFNGPLCMVETDLLEQSVHFIRIQESKFMVSGIQGLNYPNHSFKISPNPGRNTVFVDLTGTPSPQRLELRNAQGLLVFEEKIETPFNASFDLSVSHLTSGTYFVCIFDTENNLIATRRLLVQTE